MGKRGAVNGENTQCSGFEPPKKIINLAANRLSTMFIGSEFCCNIATCSETLWSGAFGLWSFWFELCYVSYVATLCSASCYHFILL